MPSADTETLPAGQTGQLAQGRLAEQLRQLDGYLEASGSGLEVERRRIAELSERLDAGRFNLAVLGQFKRGKSTLLNALLGETLLPTSVIPVTAIPTFIRFGGSPLVRVLGENGRGIEEYRGGSTEERLRFLTRYVTEEGNPHNQLEVSEVELFLPSPLLQRGVVLIDTPGIGSTYRHNTEATLNFLPQCDAALFLISADPPMTEVEGEFLREVRKRVPRLFYILNKIDYLDEAERAVALDFLHKTLQNLLGETEIPIFPISARQGLEAQLSADKDLWRDSGLENLETHLIDFLASEKAAALEEAIRRKADDVLESALMHFRLRIRSLELPQAELEERLKAFGGELDRLNRERVVAQDLVDGDKKRMLQYLEKQAEQLRKESRARLHEVVRRTPGIIGERTVDEGAAREALAAAIPAFFEKKLGAMSQEMDKHVAAVLEPHQRRLGELVEEVRRTAAHLFDIPYRPLEGARAVEFKSQPYWVTHKWDSSFSPMPENWLDRALPPAVRRSRAMKRLSQRIEDLLLHNVENLRWATVQNLDRAFVRFARLLDESLEEAIAATKGAIEAASSEREQQADAIEREMGRLKQAIDELESMRMLPGGNIA